MKVGKEEIMGCLAAVEAWLKMDVEKLNREWGARVQRIATLVGTVSGVEAKVYTPEENQCPTLAISWDQKGWRYSTADCARQLLEGTPAIAVLTEDNPSDVLSRKPTTEKASKKDDKLQIVSMTLRPGEEIIIGQRLRQLLTQARRQGTQA
jgi:L-seryl-tRNA(Ser) seleniumtransferase